MKTPDSPKPNKPSNATPHRGSPMRSIGNPTEKAKDFRGTLKRLFLYFKPYIATLVTLFVLLVISALIGTAAPKLIGLAVSKIFEGATALVQQTHESSFDYNYIAQILGILIVLYLVSAVISYFTQKMLAVIAHKTLLNIRIEFNGKLSRLPLKYFDNQPHGEIMSRTTNDIDSINNSFQQGMPQLISSLIGIVGALVMMVIISPLLTIIAVMTLFLSLGVTLLIAKHSQKHFVAQQKNLGNLNGHIEEMFSGHSVVKASGYEKISLEKFDEINERLYESGWKAQFISAFIFPMMNFISNLGYLSVCVTGGLLVASGRLLIGDVQAFVLYIRMFTQPVAQSAGVINQLQSAVAAAERIFAVLDEVEERADTELVVPRSGGEVVFDNVCFGYTDKNLFENLSLTVKKGHTVAIVGPTGAGKTSLVNLLMRFYELRKGKITVDGTDISTIKRSNLRGRFGMVLQDTWLFNGTIKENIAYARPDATEDEILAASKAVHADHFIRALPEGYNTVINEDASNLSQGEKQLLTIARAFLSDPEILILDEATSSVDTRTEALIQNAMSTLMKDRTSFVIAHRLSTIREAGLILAMDKGKIVEQGTHQSLLDARKFYHALYRSQFAGGRNENA